MKQIYKIDREFFTADDLQEFTEIEAMVPAEQLLKELEEIHEQVSGQKRQKSR